MGEGFEVLLWLGIMAVIALRSAAQNKQKAERQKRSQVPDLLDDGLESAAGFDPAPAAATTLPRRGEQRPLPERPLPRTESDRRAQSQTGRGKKGGLLSKWSELAAELERQMQEQQRSAEEAAAAARRERDLERGRDSGGGEPGGLVVPGRRVYPVRTVEPSHTPVQSRGEAGPARVAGAPSRLEARPHAEPLGPRAVHGAPRGLAGLERYSLPKRAIILSELLGEPPGLSGVAPAERRLGGLD